MVTLPLVSESEWTAFVHLVTEFSESIISEEDGSELSGMQIYGYHCWLMTLDHELRQFFRRHVEWETGHMVVGDD